MSKLFWLQGYRQVKLITTLNQDTNGCLIISPGQEHKINFGEDMVKMLRKNGVAVGDRGFCSHKLFKQFIQNGALFIIRIKSNWKWDKNYRIATRYGPVRVVCFGSIAKEVDDYLATNIPEAVMSHEEIAEAYRRAIEVLWNFLKTHLKLDKIILPCKYTQFPLFIYLILRLLKIPQIYGIKLSRDIQMGTCNSQLLDVGALCL